MSEPVRVTPVDDFVVLAGALPSPGLSDWLRRRDERSAAVLNEPVNFHPEGLLKGTFIYAHPPDYRGRPTLAYAVADWRRLLRECAELGLDTVIWQASAWMELRECYYPSEVLSSYRQWDVVGPLLEAAREERFQVWLGTVGILRGDESLGVNDQEPDKALEAADRELACYRELLQRYGGGFHGYYLSSETYYHPQMPVHRFQHYRRLYERVTHGVKALTPHLPILASPGTAPRDYQAEAAERLRECFSDARIDVVAPMDCIGQGNDLASLPAGLELWARTCRAIGAEFWVNCEAFRVTDYQGPVIQIEPADPRRFSRQLTAAACAGARGLVTWEAPHFMDPGGTEQARRLRQGYLDYRRKLPYWSPASM